jgi:hypothetical protein
MTTETSAFTGEGFAPFPNVHSDHEHISGISEFADDVLDSKITEYGEFLQRQDLMPRALKLGNRVLDHLLFESAYRDGVYEVSNE